MHKFEPNIWVDMVENDNVILAHNSNDDVCLEALFDSNGNQLTDYKYMTIFLGAEEGYFEVKSQNDKRGQLSITGNEIIPCIYTDSHYFHEGIAGMKLGNKWGFVDWHNNTVVPFEYEDITCCNDCKIGVKQKCKWGVIDKYNNKLIDFKFDDILLYVNRDCGSFPVKSGDKWGVIDIYGNILYDFIYDECDDLDEKGWFKFKKGNKWAIYSSEKDKFISRFIYDDIEYYANGLCKVKIDEKYDYVDMNNTPVSNFYYDNIKHFYGTNLVAIYKNGKCGLMNNGGKILILPKYEGGIKYASENMLVMEDDDYNQYVIDIGGNIIIPKKQHQRFYGGYSCGYIVSRWDNCYYDTKGNKLELKFNFEP